MRREEFSRLSLRRFAQASIVVLIALNLTGAARADIENGISLALLGTGLTGLAGMERRKLRVER